MNIIKRFLQKYVYQDWNIAIAEKNKNFSLKSIKWMKHNYTDRWFADPFIILDDESTYTVLAEECMYSTGRGRLVRLIVRKNDCQLLHNETILDLPTHLSFPNPITLDGVLYIYPENAKAGHTQYYPYGEILVNGKILSDLPLADSTIFEMNGAYYMLATLDEECNGNKLRIYKSNNALYGYEEIQQVTFEDNTARRAGNVFVDNGRLISPAQICNGDYGQGICLQEMTFNDGRFEFKDIRRYYPPTKAYPEGFHTYNVYKDDIVIIDGYRYGSKFLHNLYFKIRGKR